MLLEYLSPVLVTLWVRFVRHTLLPKAAWFGVALALAGLVLVAEVWQGAALNTLGVLAGLATATCSAAYFLLGERGVATSDPVGMTTWGLFIGAVTMLTVSRPWTIPGRLLAAPAQLGSVHLPVWQLLVILAGWRGGRKSHRRRTVLRPGSPWARSWGDGGRSRQPNAPRPAGRPGRCGACP